MTGKKDMIILKLGDWYISAKLSEEQPNSPNHVILVDDSSVYGEYIDGVFVVQHYDQDFEPDSKDEDIINKIARQLQYNSYKYTNTGETVAIILRPGNRD